MIGCRKTFFSGAVVLFGLFLGGCGSHHVNMGDVDDEISRLREVSLKQATDLESLQVSLKRLEGRLEVLEQSSDKVFEKEVPDIKTALDTLQKRVPPPSIVPESALEKSLASADALPVEIATELKIALQLIRSGEFAKAEKQIADTMALPNATMYLPELLFWSGVSYDGQENYRQSLLAYHRIVADHPNSPLVPAALLRQAVVFERMRDLDAMKTVLNNIINNHPHTPEAEKARLKLEGILVK